MNGLDTILKRLDDQANAEISEILAQAQGQVDAINADYATQAKALEASMTQVTAQEVESLGSRMESASDMEGRKALLGAKQDMVAQAFDKAEQAVLALPEAAYVEFLAQALAKAAPEGKGEVIFAQKDKAIAQKILDRANALVKAQGDDVSLVKAVVDQVSSKLGFGLHLSEQVRAIKGGFILVDEKMEINATVETLVRLARNQYAGDVAKTLFP